MALPPDSEFRGVAAAIAQPVSAEEACDQLTPYRNGLRTYNGRILYREPDNNQDIIEAVYRWDNRPYQEIFQTGFTPRPQSPTQTLADYFNLVQHVNHAGMPGDPAALGSVFVSTTRLARFRPIVTRNCTLYRYEIFAPGGIDVCLTLGDDYDHFRQREISYAGGISPQYIRIARAYSVTVTPGSQYPSYTRLDDNLYGNALFNPNPAADGWPPMEFFYRLRNPICPTGGDVLIEYHAREKRSTEENYVDSICKVGHYLESAFNFSDKEEVYLFIGDRCLLINYAPGTTDDFRIKEPQRIGDGFPCLKDTIFASGIDAAFTACGKNEAYIFRSNIYALINFAADGGSIIQGPKMIIDSFHSLKNTIFAKGIDAAFTSSKKTWFTSSYKNEAYIFRGNQYALINFAPGTTDDFIIQGPKKIIESFHSLKGTIFESGLDAAFSSTRENEAYIFKGDTYALINYAPGTTEDYIVNGPKKITESFSSLKNILPMYPCGCD